MGRRLADPLKAVWDLSGDSWRCGTGNGTAGSSLAAGLAGEGRASWQAKVSI